MLRELFDWVADELGLVSAVEWHCGHLPPETAGTVAVLLERGGIQSQPTIRGNVGEYMFQVLTVAGVGDGYFEARDLAYRIHGLMADRAGVELEHHTIWVIDAVAPPQFLAMDERKRFELSANYIARGNTVAAFT